MAGERPTGTVTFLFTDVEGSTSAWEADADTMRAALAAHDATIREVVARWGGYVFATGGDGFAVAFSDPSDAVLASVEAQRRLELPVRIGLHSGTADERDGDYFGQSVNRAARVMAAAHGGQILVSQTVADLVAASGGFGLIDLGDHVLADLAAPVGLHQVVGEGLVPEVRAPRSLETFQTNLPTQRSSFVGRGREIDALQAAIDHHRIVTLTGVGGVGKTRLAIHAAAARLEAYPDGVWFCELAPEHDGHGIAEAVATPIGIRQQQGLTLPESVVLGLKRRSALLVLDNCEHVLDIAADLVEEILDQCPEITLLATSREGLDVEGERILAVPSLGQPDDDAEGPSESFTLFVDRATAIRGDWDAVTDRAQVEEICRRLDGIPLAIELAAARMSAMTPAEIAENLNDRFRLLTGGRRRRRNRHQTLRAAIDWSHELLDEQTAAVFRSTAVFGGSFDIEAAVAMCEVVGVPRAAVLDSIGSLVEKSLLTVSSVAGRSRYRYLETIREYAEDRLEEAGELDAGYRAAAAHFAAWGAEAAAGLLGPEEGLWVDRLMAEAPNLRRLMDWSLDTGEPDCAAGLIASFHRSVNLHTVPLLRLATALWRAHPDGAFERAPQALTIALEDALLSSEDATAHRIFEVIERRAGITGEELPSGALNVFAQGVATIDGEPARAYELVRRALEQDRANGDRALEVADLTGAIVWGEISGAIDLVSMQRMAAEALDAAAATRSPGLMAIAQFTHGASLVMSDPEAALGPLREAEALAPTSSATHSAAVGYQARVALLVDDTDLAREIVARHALRWLKDGHTRIFGYANVVATSVAAAAADRERAVRLLRFVEQTWAFDSLWPEWRPRLEARIAELPGTASPSDPLDFDGAARLTLETLGLA